MRLLALVALGFALLGAASPAAGPTPAPISPVEVARGRIDTMLRTGHADPGWFSASFLAQVPASKVDDIVAKLIGTLGAYRSVEFTPKQFVAHFAKGTDDILIHLDADNKIDGLLFRPPVVAVSSLGGALRALQPATGVLSYVIIEEGHSERAALNASAPLAVGSAFKLAVLNALYDQIMHGSRRWTDVVPLRREWKSLPTGVLRSWPDGTPLTLATLAVEMISISDNTAADALVRLVGARALTRYAADNDPFLTTREMFTLKSDEGTSLRSAYLAAGTPASRANVLKRVDALPLPSADRLLTAPEPAVEWHYTVRELCGMLRRVASLPLMSINPGVADPSAFRHVAFKGGSDVGVINLTTMVTTVRGTNVCFSSTLNDSAHPINEAAFEAAYAAVLQYVGDHF
ncbi:MAG: serine hydrolase [Vulcanimicrobiaceae bacterium]